MKVFFLLYGAAAVTLLSGQGAECYIPVPPNADVLAWTKRELGAFFSFNMITMVPEIRNTGYFCLHAGRTATWLPPPDTFSPDLLDLDQWMQAAVAMGAKYAVLTAQHCSGFSMWPTDIYDDTGFEYAYSTRYSDFRGGSYDVVRDFVDACAKYGVKPGIYYGLNENYYLNVADGKVLDTPLVEGQAKVTQELYGLIVLAQMKELWTNYGELSEIWFDGGCSVPDISEVITDFLFTVQPHAVYYNGCPPKNHNTIRWVGTETGMPNYPIWSTSTNCGRGPGSPDGEFFCPVESDTTLQEDEQWFWKPGLPIRNLSELQQVYYHTVGQNTNLLLNIPGNSSGLIQNTFFQRYQEFGDWIRTCFNSSLAKTQGKGYYFELNMAEPKVLDHILVSEDQSLGQLVLNFTVSAILPDSSEILLVEGQSVGNKFVRPIPAVTTSKVVLSITAAHAEPSLRQFSVHDC